MREMDDQLLKDMAQDIGETKGMVKAIVDDIDKIDKSLNRHDTRIRRIENFFLPAIAVLSLVSQKILKVIGL